MPKNKFDTFLNIEKKKNYFIELQSKLRQEEINYEIYPAEKDRFRALKFFEPEDTKLIILGQDPYYLAGQADGLAFSTRQNKCPRSLNNMLKELIKDYPNSIIETYSLESWAKQGILLINTTLSVRSKTPNSHSALGWDIFVKNLIKYVIGFNPKVLFGLWGKQAQDFVKEFIDLKLISRDQIIACSHPSPLSYSRSTNSFKDFNFYKKVNQKLTKPIDFSLRKENHDSNIKRIK
ncbi:uracil-DNA glycosylase [Mycoplasma zalophidermidis]|uniref:Uracil-DNA glycosylase n=1 Tax=Mycoplasma zalophidermidis TaxID=398174 RepID=A0ABS6DSC6_9MOLU|nr:uracil-DNA glycosylase [Mycoplasma zalophidermidis]MBU4689945.1 uracil-DNA glycosylase [Mycoplasma zalophidermidis]MBU4693764.1 uracil-DNA glycosylase [Mycoplasma zalophidermidis]MCR8966770.1 uracil-DNA glycosylase [Mycoplasma zalophidermidis]